MSSVCPIIITKLTMIVKPTYFETNLYSKCNKKNIVEVYLDTNEVLVLLTNFNN